MPQSDAAPQLGAISLHIVKTTIFLNFKSKASTLVQTGRARRLLSYLVTNMKPVSR
jgi:hypothetical protein